MEKTRVELKKNQTPKLESPTNRRTNYQKIKTSMVLALASHDCMERATKLKHNLIKIKNTSYASVMTNPCKDQETPKSVNPVKGG